MPFQSKAQRRKFYALKARGKMSQKKIDEWESHTPKKLPEKKKGFALKHAYYLGYVAAMQKLGMDADSFESFATDDDTDQDTKNPHRQLDREEGDEDEEDEDELSPLEENQEKLINPPSPWAGSTLIGGNNATDF